MEKILATVITFFLLLTLLFVGKPLLAATRCETYYGGEVCVHTGELQIDKEVWNIEDELWVDNMNLDDYKFSPGEEITFKLKIKNVGDETFDSVSVKDTLPDYLELVSGYLEFEIDNLEVDETEEREIKTRVISADKFPDDTTICDRNTAEAWSEDEKDKDTAQICMKEKVLGAKILPPTGPKKWFLIFLSTLMAGTIGIYFIKFSKKY